MIRKRFLRSSAILASSIASLVPHGTAKASEAEKYSKRMKESVLVQGNLAPIASGAGTDDPPSGVKERYPWKRQIVTTTFWVGEKAAQNNPVPNHVSSWDPHWAENYGGTDWPERAKRANYIPADFTPRQNPFYV